jgi:hypothetical protein
MSVTFVFGTEYRIQVRLVILLFYSTVSAADAELFECLAVTLYIDLCAYSNIRCLRSGALGSPQGLLNLTRFT